VLVGGVVRVVGFENETLDVNDSEAIAVELAAEVSVRAEDEAACLGRRSPCRRSPKSSLLGPKSRAMKCAVFFHGDGDVDSIMSCSPSSRDIPDTL
jgi:hypothetical protein